MGKMRYYIGRWRRGWLSAGVALATLASPFVGCGVSRADDGDGIAGLAVLMGIAAEAAVEHVRIEDKTFIDQCTEAKIAKWRGRDIRVSSLYDAKALEDECVLEAVAMEVATIKAEEEGRAAREKAEADAEAVATAARVAEAQAISDRVADSHRRGVERSASHRAVIAASGPVAVHGSLKGRRRVEYLANGSVQINW